MRCSGSAAEGDLHRHKGGKSALLAFAVVGLCTESAWAQAPPVEHGSFSILVENDLFYRSDRDYSSGVEFAYTTAPDETPDILVTTAHGLSGLFSSGEVRASYELGQDIFTPAATQLANPPLTQRPYAGFLWAGVAILTKDAQRLNQLEMQVGVIGPASLAANAQIFTHSILGEPKPQGWHYQLRDEPALQFTYERTYKIIPPRSGLGLVFDVEPHLGAAIGNVYDYVNAGAMARAGINLPDDFGPLRLQPALPGSNFFEAPRGFSAYAFVGVDARAIARNLFLDGNTFEPSRHVDKNLLVGDLQLGLALAVERVRLSFTHVFRTREYRTQPHSDQFGAINLTIQT